ncbi:hypothetical protein [Chitinilyticum piscinae]|uniref:Uncharacterized protein n=1 Tax=Chitinilyticum piscinae TaxID=2866724 RepID=A0A8J7G296_9NEIS|nr:hypothetical protein [Chitinilyticum piscinae]MBE9610655.1 hypothetical protein [Chitinilyticum piscinae]
MFARLLHILRDLNALYLNPQFDGVSRQVYGQPLKRFLRLNLSLCYRVLYHVLHRGKAVPQPRTDLLFYANTVNQMRAMAPLQQAVVAPALRAGHGVPVDVPFPMLALHLWGLFLLPFFWLALPWLQSETRRRVMYFFDGFVLALPASWLAKRWLGRLQPRVLVQSNDHNPLNRAVLRAAQSLGITTVYLQHAPVAAYFPLLEHDVSLLDGQDALDKYRHAGPPRSRIVLTGPVRLVLSAVPSRAVPAIGVATNTIDRLDDVAAMIGVVMASGDWPIVLRPHPGDARFDEWRRLAERLAVGFSDSRSEPSTQYLGQLQRMIAADCGIHLDAALLDIESVCCGLLGAGSTDSYGFVRAGLCPAADSAQALREWLLRDPAGPSPRQRARYYFASIGAQNEARVAEVAAQLLDELVEGRDIAQNRLIRWQSPGGYFELI